MSKRYSAGVAAIFDQLHDLTASNKVKCLLIRSGSSVTSEDAATLGAFSSLLECRDGGYTSQYLTGVTIAQSGTNVIFDANNPSFSNTGDQSGDSIIGCLYAIYTGATQANWIPLSYTAFNAAKTQTGTAWPVEIHANGFYGLTCAASTHKVYAKGIERVAKQLTNMETSNKVYTRLLMTNTTAFTDNPTTVSGFTTLDECNDTTYAAAGLHYLTSVAVTNSSGIVQAAAANPSFTNAGNASRDVRYLLHCLYVDGTAANDVPLSLQRLDTDVTLNGVTLPCYLPSSGFLKLTP